MTEFVAVHVASNERASSDQARRLGEEGRAKSVEFVVVRAYARLRLNNEIAKATHATIDRQQTAEGELEIHWVRRLGDVGAQICDGPPPRRVVPNE